MVWYDPRTWFRKKVIVKKEVIPPKVTAVRAIDVVKPGEGAVGIVARGRRAWEREPEVVTVTPVGVPKEEAVKIAKEVAGVPEPPKAPTPPITKPLITEPPKRTFFDRFDVERKRFDWGGISVTTPFVRAGEFLGRQVTERMPEEVPYMGMFPAMGVGITRPRVRVIEKKALEALAPPIMTRILDIFIKGMIFAPYMETGVAKKAKAKAKQEIKYVRKFETEKEAKETAEAIVGKYERIYAERGREAMERELARTFGKLKTPEAKKGGELLLRRLYEKGLLKGAVYKPETGQLIFGDIGKMIGGVRITPPKPIVQIFTDMPPTMKGVEIVETGAKVFGEFMPRTRFPFLGVMEGRIPLTGVIRPITKPKLITKLTQIPPTKLAQPIITMPKPRERPREKMVTLPRAIPKTMARQIQPPKLGQPPLLIPKMEQPQLPRMGQPQLQAPKAPFPFPRGIPRYGFPKFAFPFLPLLFGWEKRPKKGIRPTRGFRYQPGVYARAMGITAPKPPELAWTGIVTRPMIRRKRKKKWEGESLI